MTSPNGRFVIPASTSISDMAGSPSGTDALPASLLPDAVADLRWLPLEEREPRSPAGSAVECSPLRGRCQAHRPSLLARPVVPPRMLLSPSPLRTREGRCGRISHLVLRLGRTSGRTRCTWVPCSRDEYGSACGTGGRWVSAQERPRAPYHSKPKLVRQAVEVDVFSENQVHYSGGEPYAVETRHFPTLVRYFLYVAEL